MKTEENIVKNLWQIFHRREFHEVKPLLAENFMCLWPQSNELIRGADNFIAINENYPGRWAIECKRIVGDGNNVVSEVKLTCKGQTVYATSFFEFKNCKIARMTEYWSEPYEAPNWRKQWTERIAG